MILPSYIELIILRDHLGRVIDLTDVLSIGTIKAEIEIAEKEVDVSNGVRLNSALIFCVFD